MNHNIVEFWQRFKSGFSRFFHALLLWTRSAYVGEEINLITKFSWCVHKDCGLRSSLFFPHEIMMKEGSQCQQFELLGSSAKAEWCITVSCNTEIVLCGTETVPCGTLPLPMSKRNAVQLRECCTWEMSAVRHCWPCWLEEFHSERFSERFFSSSEIKKCTRVQF